MRRRSESGVRFMLVGPFHLVNAWPPFYWLNWWTIRAATNARNDLETVWAVVTVCCYPRIVSVTRNQKQTKIRKSIVTLCVWPEIVAPSSLKTRITEITMKNVPRWEWPNSRCRYAHWCVSPLLWWCACQYCPRQCPPHWSCWWWEIRLWLNCMHSKWANFPSPNPAEFQRLHYKTDRMDAPDFRYGTNSCEYRETHRENWECEEWWMSFSVPTECRAFCLIGASTCRKFNCGHSTKWYFS